MKRKKYFLLLSWVLLVFFEGACSGNNLFQRGHDQPSSYYSIFSKGEGALEFKWVDESLSDNRLLDLVSEVRTKKNIPEGSYDAKTVADINQALGSQIPVRTEIAYELRFDPIDSTKIDKALPLLLVKKGHGDSCNLQEEHIPPMPYVFAAQSEGTEDFKVIISQNIGKKLAVL